MYLKLLKQKGFSLPELMVAMGIMGGISIVTMKLVENQANQENLLRANTEISKTVSLIQNAVNNQNNCKLLFNNVTRGTSMAALQLPVTGGNKVLLEDGRTRTPAKMNYGAFEVWPNDIQLTNSTYSTGSVADLVLNFRVKKGGWAFGDTNVASNYHTVTRRIPIIVTLNGANQVTSCGPVVSDANNSAREKFCLSLGGAATWDAGSNRCILRSMDCPWGQVPSTLTSLGGVICQPLQNVMNLEQVFDTSPSSVCASGNYSITSQNGKFKIRCN